MTPTDLNACGCCEGVEPLTPQSLSNRPGLSALRYRVGTHGSFLETMKARLSSLYLDIPTQSVDSQGHQVIEQVYPLQGLKTRAADDPSIALLDAWATVADVLTFYQERIANEGYLRTATERRSILELARLVGYRLRPGVAASVNLAFTLEKDYEVTIPVGTRAQSVPQPGELPQSFETSDPLPARTAWNKISPRQTRPQYITDETDTLYFEGTATNLKPNDLLLIVYGEYVGGQTSRWVESVEVQIPENRTKVTLQMPSAFQKTMAFIEATDKTLQRYLAMEEFGINPQAEMAQRVAGLLGDIRAGLQRNEPVEKIAALIQDALPHLEEEHQVAVENSYSRLAPWVGGVVAELQKLAGKAPGAVAGAETPASAAKALMASSAKGSNEDGGSQVFANLFSLVPTLQKPASIPPRNTFSLQRSVSQIFSSQADMVPRLLSTLHPTLKPALYAAWGHAATYAATPEVYVLRQKAPLFGHNAQKQVEIARGTGKVTVIGDWPIIETDPYNDSNQLYHEDSNAVHLDAAYDKILPDSWLVVVTKDTLLTSAKTIVAKAGSPDASISRAEYGMSGKTTRIELDTPGIPGDTQTWIKLDGKPNDPPYPEFAAIRKTAVYAQSEKLTLAEQPLSTEEVPNPVEGDQIELDGLYDGLETGRWLIVSGERTDISDANGETVTGVEASELVMLSGVTQGAYQLITQYSTMDLPGDKPHTTLLLAKKLAYSYKRDATWVYGNVVKATHGETRAEVLGNGDGSKALQQFTLRQPPLTYVAAATPAGAQSTLQVRVNEVEWHEADNLFSLSSTDREFITQTDNEGKTTVIFGDGAHGARLPTGAGNVKAVYRSGIGKPGNVGAEQISLLASKPLGVKEVINPLRASGGADAESRDQARRNAPLAVTALDRLVSVQDYADFARTFAGIGKASAARLSDGRRQFVHVTIAGAEDIPIDSSSDLYRNLVEALHEFGEPYLPLQVETRQLLLLVLSAKVRVLADYQWESVEPQVRAALLDAYGFEQRDLGQDALLSEIISIIQGVRGVDYVDVDVFASVPEDISPDDLTGLTDPTNPNYLGLTPRIPVGLDRIEDNGQNTRQILPAQLAMFSPEVPDTLILTELSL